jgi:hypothetical protein
VASSEADGRDAALYDDAVTTTSARAIRKSLRTNFDPGPRDYLNRVLLRGRQAAHVPGLLAGGRVREPIFIIGAPRSGTSILYRILRAHPQLEHWPGEAHEVWEAEHHPALTGWRSNALTAVDASDKTRDRIRRSFYLVIGGKRLIDKTPRNSLRVPFIDGVFEDARYVFLTRDGRENINSLINAWRTPRYRTYALPRPHSIPGADPAWWKFVLYPGWEQDVAGPLERVCAHQWLACNRAALQAFEGPAGSRMQTISYEALVEDPTSETESLLGALGLEPSDAVRKGAEESRTRPVNVVTPPERGKYKRENPGEVESIMPLITATMKELGYEI